MNKQRFQKPSDIMSTVTDGGIVDHWKIDVLDYISLGGYDLVDRLGHVMVRDLVT